MPAGVKVRNAAVGLHALVDGLIANWVADPDYFALDREAEGMIDLFLDGLRATKPPPKHRVRAGTAPARRSSSRPHPAPGGRSPAR